MHNLNRRYNDHSHWVGDGFPVRSLFSYNQLGAHVSLFLLLDYAGPHYFEPTSDRRGVGEHPHRGFETVTIVYDGEVEHRDSAGNGGIIGPGDVQWMTAAGGIIHEEYHSPAKDKMAPSGYQGIVSADIPVVDLPDGGGSARIIAGNLFGAQGPAKTFTPINMWDVKLSRDADLNLPLPEGHTCQRPGIRALAPRDSTFGLPSQPSRVHSQDGQADHWGITMAATFRRRPIYFRTRETPRP